MAEVNRAWTMAAYPHGEPKLSDFALTESPIPTPGPGEPLAAPGGQFRAQVSHSPRRRRPLDRAHRRHAKFPGQQLRYPGRRRQSLDQRVAGRDVGRGRVHHVHFRRALAADAFEPMEQHRLAGSTRGCAGASAASDREPECGCLAGCGLAVAPSTLPTYRCRDPNARPSCAKPLVSAVDAPHCRV